MCFKWIVNNLEKDISNIHMHKTVKKLVYVDNYGKKIYLSTSYSHVVDRIM